LALKLYLCCPAEPKHKLVMDSFWWTAGAVFSALYTAVGALGNGLTIAILIKFRQFRNAIGFCVLRYNLIRINYWLVFCFDCSLTLADFLRCVFITSTNLSLFINTGRLSISLFACMLYRATAYAVLTVSGFSISLIAVNRLATFNLSLYMQKV
jgi:hypothetical protein